MESTIKYSGKIWHCSPTLYGHSDPDKRIISFEIETGKCRKYPIILECYYVVNSSEAPSIHRQIKEGQLITVEGKLTRYLSEPLDDQCTSVKIPRVEVTTVNFDDTTLINTVMFQGYVIGEPDINSLGESLSSQSLRYFPV